jgi:hypothetical protein
MTPVQAKEYATRIRLGEQVWFWTYKPPPRGITQIGACFSDGSGVASRIEATGQRWGNWPWKPDTTQAPLPELKASHDNQWEPLSAENTAAVLGALDRLAAQDVKIK